MCVELFQFDTGVPVFYLFFQEKQTAKARQANEIDTIWISYGIMHIKSVVQLIKRPQRKICLIQKEKYGKTTKLKTFFQRKNSKTKKNKGKKPVKNVLNFLG